MKKSVPRRRRFEVLESRHLLAADVVISEFLASNQNGLRDEDGDDSDWIELLNMGDMPISLSQFALTDDAEELTKWILPDVILRVGETVLIFASGKDRGTTDGELHANFRLSADGEYLALVEPDGSTIASEFAPGYPTQVANVSYGIAANGKTQVVINEVMYHPSSKNKAEEYIELHNVRSQEIELDGWSFRDGVDFSFSGVSIPPNGYLVVAADPNVLLAKYPQVTSLVGPWDGSLSNGRERITLIDRAGRVVDTVRYADEGEWGVRAQGEPDRGTRGWIWLDDHDGGGKSLELVAPTLPNQYGQNWKASLPAQGTPGAVNSVHAATIPPLILDVTHAPAAPIGP